MLENIKQKISCVGFALFLLLTAGCAADRKIEMATDAPEDEINAKRGILYRGVIAATFYGQGLAFAHRMRGTHKSASKFALRTSVNQPNNPVERAKRVGVSPVFGGIDVRSQYFDRGFLESSYEDVHPFVVSPNNSVSDGDLVDFLIQPLRINMPWEGIAFSSVPLKDSWDDVRAYRGIVLRVVCKATDEACFDREFRSYPCDDGAMVIDGERRPDRSCGGYGPVSEEHASVIGPINEIYGSFDNYLKVHNIPWDEECLTETFDCDRENGNAIPFQGYDEWLETRPNYIPAQELATEFYDDEGDWDDEDRAWLEYLSSQMLSPQEAMSKEEFLQTYSQ